MAMRSTNELRRTIKEQHDVEFAEFIRTHYWASFNILPVVAEKCGITIEELHTSIAEEEWALQKPPSLALQNCPVGTLDQLDAVSRPDQDLDSFIQDSDGTPADHATRLSCHVERNRIRLHIECAEEYMQGVSLEPEAIADPDAEIIWSGHTEAAKHTAARKKGWQAFLEWAPHIGDRNDSIFSRDCVMLTLTALSIGDCQTRMNGIRRCNNPVTFLTNPPLKPETSKVYLEGSYYYIAIAPSGKIVGAFHDPWDDGVYWPCWQSGAKADVTCSDDGWALDISLPLDNLEPLAVNNSVWGIDCFRYRPRREGGPAEWSRSSESLYIRQVGNDLGEGRFLSKPEEFTIPGARHAYIASEYPFADSVIPHDLPSVDIRTIQTGTDALDDVDWTDTAAINTAWLDHTGAQSQYATDVRIACDDAFLYVRFDCHDDDTANLRVVSKEEELAKYGDRNRRANYLDRREAFGLDWGDYVEILLAPGLEDTDIYHGGYYNILINSRGDILKRYYDPYGAFTLDETDAWSPELRVKIKIKDDCWQTFIAIPLSSLHNVDRATDTWRGNFKRARGTRDPESPTCEGSEISAWSPEYGRCRLLERWGFLNFNGPLPRARTAGRVIVPGETSEGIERPTSPTATQDHLAGVSFATPEKGWAVGGLGTILHTNDGGTSWHSQNSGCDYALDNICFLDEHRGVAVGGRPRSQRVAIYGSSGVILLTSDGGENWQALFSEKGVHLSALHFADEKTGYAAGEYGVILKTTDSGALWTHMANTGTDAWLTSVHFVDALHGWAAGEHGVVIATDDGGRSWQRRDAPTSDAPYGVRAAVRSICFVNQREGWVAGDRGTFLHTLDGGASWQPVPLGLSADASDVMHFKALRFADAQTGILLGEPGSTLFHTADGGKTWHREEGATAVSLRDACFDSHGHAWAVGEYGSIARRVAGEWKQVSPDSARPRVLFGTPHGHHVKSTCWSAMADEYDVSGTFVGHSKSLYSRSEERLRAGINVGCMEAGMRGTRCMADVSGGRRREPHRICHLYQNWLGIEPTERRLAAVIRSIKPEVVIAEWPILQEGYWAADVGLFARALIRAFDSAADPDCFPELLELGLAPWRAQRLYTGRGLPFSEIYGIDNRRDWVIRGSEKQVVENLGMHIGDLQYRGSCSWTSLLDRGRPRKPNPLGDYVYESSFHLLKDTTPADFENT